MMTVNIKQISVKIVNYGIWQN